MTDQPGQAAKGGDPETIFNSGIGDDWGEAFEAEDFMASPNDETNADFFLPDELTASTVSSAPVGGVAEATAPAVSSPGPPFGLPQSIFARLRAIPLPLRLVAAVIPVLALGLFLSLRGESPEQMDENEVVPAKVATAPVANSPEPERSAELEALQPPLPVAQALSESPPPGSTPEVAAEQSKGALMPAPFDANEIRKKWHFPAIIIHAKTDKDQGTVILSIDLTLVLKLAPEVMLPYDKEAFVREILYQFYANQPVGDLQRYALERSELNRKMQDWIMKQWPELQLDSVATERYQLL